MYSGTIDAGTIAPDCQCGVCQLRILEGKLPDDQYGKPLYQIMRVGESRSFELEALCPCMKWHTFKVFQSEFGTTISLVSVEQKKDNK